MKEPNLHTWHQETADRIRRHVTGYSASGWDGRPADACYTNEERKRSNVRFKTPTSALENEPHACPEHAENTAGSQYRVTWFSSAVAHLGFLTSLSDKS
jgi:hypothetical protein